MSLQYWSEPLVVATAAGTNFTSFTTAKSVTPTGCIWTAPANYFYVGKMMRMTIHGDETHATGNTMTFQFELGSVAAFGSGALAMTTTTHTTWPFVAQCIVTCRSVGSGTSATLIGRWLVHGPGFVFGGTPGADFSAGSGYAIGPTGGASVAGTGFDSTATQNIDFFAAMSTSAAGLGIQVHQYLLESLN